MSGLTAIDAIGGANGTLVNMVGNEWTDGFHDGGLAFDGSNDYITVGQVSSLQLAETMTIAAWVKADSFPQWGGIAGWLHDTGSTESGYTLNTMSGGGLSFGLKTAGQGMTYLTASGYETGQWYHVAGTYNGSMQRLYVNGEPVAEQTNTGAIGGGIWSEFPCLSHPRVDCRQDIRRWSIGSRGRESHGSPPALPHSHGNSRAEHDLRAVFSR